MGWPSNPQCTKQYSTENRGCEGFTSIASSLRQRVTQTQHLFISDPLKPQHFSATQTTTAKSQKLLGKKILPSGHDTRCRVDSSRCAGHALVDLKNAWHLKSIDPDNNSWIYLDLRMGLHGVTWALQGTIAIYCILYHTITMNYIELQWMMHLVLVDICWYYENLQYWKIFEYVWIYWMIFEYIIWLYLYIERILQVWNGLKWFEHVWTTYRWNTWTDDIT